MKLKPGTAVMVNEKYPGEGVGDIGVVVESVPWFWGYTVSDGDGVELYRDDELEVLHVPVEVGDIVMFESNPEGASVDRVGTVGLVTEARPGSLICWIQVSHLGWPISCLIERLTVVG
jgi:hypothetical protein